jgi:hypothetical protein
LGCIDCPSGPWHIAHAMLAFALPAATSAAWAALGSTEVMTVISMMENAVI